MIWFTSSQPGHGVEMNGDHHIRYLADSLLCEEEPLHPRTGTEIISTPARHCHHRKQGRGGSTSGQKYEMSELDGASRSCNADILLM